MESQSLTPRQRDVLNYLVREAWDFNKPTIREMCDRLEINSPNGVAEHLRKLRVKGYITSSGLSRGIVLTQNPLLEAREIVRSLRGVAVIPEETQTRILALLTLDGGAT